MSYTAASYYGTVRNGGGPKTKDQSAVFLHGFPVRRSFMGIGMASLIVLVRMTGNRKQKKIKRETERER